MIQRLPFSYPGIEGDVGRLGVLLGEVFAVAGVSFSGRLAVLNLACGRADETGVLVGALEPAEVGFYLGVDVRGEAVAEARARWELPGGEVEFCEGNAAMVGRVGGVGEFDLVFIRHQNYWHEPMVWEGILAEALAVLRCGGKLVCTSYFDLEHELFVASMRERGARRLASVRHAASRALPDGVGKSVDRWMGVWEK